MAIVASTASAAAAAAGTSSVAAAAISAAAATAASKAAITASAATAEATASVAAAAAAAATIATAMGIVNLDFLAIQNLAIQLLDGGLSAGVVSHCNEGVTFLGDIDIGDFTASSEFGFQSISGVASINTVDKKFGHLRYYVPEDQMNVDKCKNKCCLA